MTYDPTIGRFLSEDPSGLEPDSNPYRYAYNTPTLLTDPSGLNPNQFGAKDGDEVIQIVKGLEENYRKVHGKYPDWKTGLKLFKDDMLRQVDAGSNHYYVFSQQHDRWIDLRHFAESAIGVSSGLLTVQEVILAGDLMEVFQKTDELSRPYTPGTDAAGNAASAFGVEDKYSNWLGANFGAVNLERERDGECFLLSGTLARFFTEIDVGSKSAAETLTRLPKDEAEWQKWRLTPGLFKQLSEVEGAMVAPKKGLSPPTENKPRFPYWGLPIGPPFLR